MIYFYAFLIFAHGVSFHYSLRYLCEHRASWLYVKRVWWDWFGLIAMAVVPVLNLLYVWTLKSTDPQRKQK